MIGEPKEAGQPRETGLLNERGAKLKAKDSMRRQADEEQEEDAGQRRKRARSTASSPAPERVRDRVPKAIDVPVSNGRR